MEKFKCKKCKSSKLKTKQFSGTHLRFICLDCGQHSQFAKAGYASHYTDEDMKTFMKKGEKEEVEIMGGKRFDNIAIVIHRSKEPMGAEELMAKTKFDKTIWKISNDNVQPGYYEMPIKSRDGEINIVRLYKLQLRLVRIMPVKHVMPPMAVIHVKMSKPKAFKTTSGLKRCLVIPDSQNGYRRDMESGMLDPFHDRLAWDLMVQLSAEIKPDRVVLLGDMLDLPAWTDKFLKSPDFYFTTQPAMNELAWWIAQIRCNTNQMDYIEGNHEYRMQRSMINYQPEAWGLRPVDVDEKSAALSIDNLLGLGRMGITYHKSYPKGHIWLNDKIRISHGILARSGGGETTKSILSTIRNTEIFGHIHRVETSSKTIHDRRGREVFTAASPGCICRVDGTVPSTTDRHDWQQGWMLVDYDDKRMESIHNFRIDEGQTIYNGKVFSGRDRLVELRVATKCNFF